MFWIDLFFASIIAFVFSILLTVVLGWRRPGASGIWPSVFFLFMLLFFGVWAGGIWLIPFGPKMLDIYFLPFLVSALAFSLIIIALIPPPKRTDETIKLVRTDTENKSDSNKTRRLWGVFFWFLLAGLLIVIVLKYVL